MNKLQAFVNEEIGKLVKKHHEQLVDYTKTNRSAFFYLQIKEQLTDMSPAPPDHEVLHAVRTALKPHRLVRNFGGKVGNTVTNGNKKGDFVDRQERAFEKAHLDAYIRGSGTFIFGYQTDPKTGLRNPVFHQTKVLWV